MLTNIINVNKLLTFNFPARSTGIMSDGKSSNRPSEITESGKNIF